MSGVNFITADPASAPYDQETKTIDDAAKTGQQIGVDNAVRAGIGDMLAAKQSQQPAPSDGTAPYQAPMPSQAAPANSNTPGATPIPTTPTMAPATPQQATAQLESGGNPGASNPQGYIGKYGFGKAALMDAGIYTQGGVGAWDNKDWSGTFHVPGYGDMNYDQFMANGPAQDAAYQAHQAQMDKQISALGLNSYIGQTVGGVPITQDTLRGMVHGGGAFGTKQFLESGGTHNPADANGTSIADFGMKIGMPGGQPASQVATGGMNPTDASAVTGYATEVQPNAFMPGANGSRYDPILARLAQAPGGGTAALSLLEKQGTFDQQNYRRSDTYQRLAMQALSHGDTTTARFYAQAGGLQLPDQVMSNQNNATLFGRAGILAHQIYGSDPMQAQAFVNDYLQSGDVTHAFSAAGAPRSNPNYQLSWAQQIDGTLKAQTFNKQTGQITDATDANGQPVTRLPTAPAATVNANNRVQMLTSIGVPHDQAVQIVANPGASLHPGTVAAAYQSTYRSISSSIDGIGMDEPTKQAKVASTMDSMFGPGWRSVMQPTGAGGNGTPGYVAPQPAPAQGAPTGAGAPALPGSAGPMGTLSPGDQQASIANARNAIASGKSPALVVQRLQQMGVPVPPDLMALTNHP
jgi:hypothetical protein